ncbi:hypothetical protein Q5424_01270 [Conexibacter sp. JD483]|uniref:hypothetical protein n=1 Tax=unclassified Conexibacter TaxID=2627773 RepID=UPI002721BC88|nr:MULTISPECIES: hypothetical protein [unclassified Conexibacter]MDO8185859.1 hypothetical protein [Conexibacter sp. CPCC 205706]MDO8198603.1 hypothetical protein [Conexibacter sp. CPCC 205762]MDR9367689.1 hypothetical protein [Conexibacter sp. JD483]
MAPEPYRVALTVRHREWCDADTVQGHRCRHDATTIFRSGALSGERYCTFHAGRLGVRSWKREAIPKVRVVGRRAFDALESARDWADGVLRAALDETKAWADVDATQDAAFAHRDEAQTVAVGVVALPDGRGIAVEQATRQALYDEISPELAPAWTYGTWELVEAWNNEHAVEAWPRRRRV